MKRTVLAALVAIIVFSALSSTEAREPKTERPIFYRPDYEETRIDFSGCEAMLSLASATAVDTYCVFKKVDCLQPVILKKSFY